MSDSFLFIGGAMFIIPLFLMLAIAIFGDIPSQILFVGGWSMALGVVTAGIGAALSLLNGQNN